MKIAYVTMQYPVPSETFAVIEVNELKRRGFDVDIYGMRFKHRDFTSLTDNMGVDPSSVSNLKFIDLLKFPKDLFKFREELFALVIWILNHSISNFHHLLKSFLLIPSAISIYKDINVCKPAVVHLFWGHYPAMVGFLIKKYQPDIDVSMFLGSHDLETNYPGSLAFSNNADYLFTHSKDNLELLNELNYEVEKFNVVHRGIVLDNKYSENDKSFQFKTEAPVFITASRLIKEKGTDKVLYVFKEVTKNWPNSTLHIAGDGPYKKQLKNIVKELNLVDRVKFHGHIEQQELFKLFEEAHIFLLFSNFKGERLPNVIKEAMYKGCICFTTRTPGIDELIQNDINGFVIDEDNISSLVKYVSQTIRKPDFFLKEVSVTAKEFVAENFNVEKSIGMYLKTWNKI